MLSTSGGLGACLSWIKGNHWILFFFILLEKQTVIRPGFKPHTGTQSLFHYTSSQLLSIQRSLQNVHCQSAWQGILIDLVQQGCVFSNASPGRSWALGGMVHIGNCEFRSFAVLPRPAILLCSDSFFSIKNALCLCFGEQLKLYFSPLTPISELDLITGPFPCPPWLIKNKISQMDKSLL